MAVDSYDPTTGRPIFLDTGAPDIGVDPTEVGKYAADVGNRIVRADLAALNAYSYKRAGLSGYAADTKRDYVYDGSGWRGAAEDTGWIAATLQSAWINAAAGEEVEYRRLNGVVYFKGRAANGTGTTVLTLPPGFRPKSISRFIVPTAATAANPLLVYVSSNGVVTASVGGQPNLASLFFPADL